MVGVKSSLRVKKKSHHMPLGKKKRKTTKYTVGKTIVFLPNPSNVLSLFRSDVIGIMANTE